LLRRFVGGEVNNTPQLLGSDLSKNRAIRRDGPFVCE